MYRHRILLRAALPLLVILPWAQPAPAQDAGMPIPPSGVIGVNEEMLSPDYWVARATGPDAPLLTPDQVEARNQKTFARDPAMFDLGKLGANLTRAQIAGWLKLASSPLDGPLVDAGGTALPAGAIAAIRANAVADNVPASLPTRFGLSVRRAQLRTWPTAVRAFPSKDLTDFESFQGGTLFPDDAVVILHASADAKWLLVLSYQGPAWVASTDIAQGSRAAVLGYAGKAPFRVVTGDEVRTVFTPEAPAVSQLQLDMGVRVPLADLPPGEPVNGQGSYVSWPITLPTRQADGTLRFQPALLQRNRDSAPGYLPLTRANIIRQAFKFLGERYGWGHLYNARDCSGFTSDVYRSMGILLPPNSGAQGQNPGTPHRTFTASDTREARIAAVMKADIGDLIVVPGHVLMIVGKVDGRPYVLQDVPFAIFRDAAGAIHRTKLNQVSVTPLLPLLADDTHTYVEAMTSLVHVTARGD